MYDSVRALETADKKEKGNSSIIIAETLLRIGFR